MPSTEPTAHVVFLAAEAWGHTRPLCALAVRLLQECPVFITFFTSPKFVDRVEAELLRSFGPGSEDLRDLVRVIALDVPEGSPIDPTIFKAFAESFSKAYGQMVEGQPLVCAFTGKEVKAVEPPDAFIMDLFLVLPLETVRKLSKKPVKVYAWMSGQASALIYAAAPERMGGRGDLRFRISNEAARTGEPVEQVTEKILFETNGELIHIAGLPPMHDYEFHPQDTLLKGITGWAFMLVIAFIEKCDGLIFSVPEPYEPESITEIKAWFAETQREVYTLGPLLPLGEDTAAGEEKQSEASAEIAQFMQKIAQTQGPESLLYISFGSVWWSTQAEKVWAFLDVVIEKDIPFIMSIASPFAVVPDEMYAKVKAYGKGIVSKWTPQQTILAHPATGWFVTHAGQNGVIEAITVGVPMICWPFSADQPGNSARLSVILDVAYELLEVRTGPHGLKPLYRTGKAPVGTTDAVREEARAVLDKAFGEDGARKRANIKTLKEAVLSTYNEDGPARRDLKRFIASLPAPSYI